ncbi:MAG: glycosyltransferase [Sulfurovum sp.]|nr:glycosyltransferase [Sulfurovum sp.]
MGKMDKKEIACTLAQSDGYLIASNYETFSVVSAQALCCGVPIIGSKLSAIEEYADKECYLSLDENNPKDWMIKLLYFIKNKNMYNHKNIALKANITLDNHRIKTLYKQTLEKWFG